MPYDFTKPQGLRPLDGSGHVHDFTDAHTDSHGITWRKCTGCPAELTFIPDAPPAKP